MATVRAILQGQSPLSRSDKDRVDDIAATQKILFFGDLQNKRVNVEGEVFEVTLTNTDDFPFNTTQQNPTSIALGAVRTTTNYTVEKEILEHVGLPGDIEIIDKALNGFKVYFTGSGSSVKVLLKVRGGLN